MESGVLPPPVTLACYTCPQRVSKCTTVYTAPCAYPCPCLYHRKITGSSLIRRSVCMSACHRCNTRHRQGSQRNQKGYPCILVCFPSHHVITGNVASGYTLGKATRCRPPVLRFIFSQQKSCVVAYHPKKPACPVRC